MQEIEIKVPTPALQQVSTVFGAFSVNWAVSIKMEGPERRYTQADGRRTVPAKALVILVRHEHYLEQALTCRFLFRSLTSHNLLSSAPVTFLKWLLHPGNQLFVVVVVGVSVLWHLGVGVKPRISYLQDSTTTAGPQAAIWSFKPEELG